MRRLVTMDPKRQRIKTAWHGIIGKGCSPLNPKKGEEEKFIRNGNDLGGGQRNNYSVNATTTQRIETTARRIETTAQRIETTARRIETTARRDWKEIPPTQTKPKQEKRSLLLSSLGGGQLNITDATIGHDGSETTTNQNDNESRRHGIIGKGCPPPDQKKEKKKSSF